MKHPELVTLRAMLHTISGYSLSKDNMTVQAMIEDAIAGYTFPSLKVMGYTQRNKVLADLIAETIAQCGCYTRHNDSVIVIVETDCNYTKKLAENECRKLELTAASSIRNTPTPNTCRIRIATRQNDNAKSPLLYQAVMNAIRDKKTSTHSFKAEKAQFKQKTAFTKFFSTKPAREAYSEKMFRRQWCHEFGHMLGLTDDYHKLHANSEQTYKQFGFSDQDMITLKATLTVNNYTAEDLFIYSQRRYLELCQVAQVTPPLLSRPSMSIMSNGNYVMPSHVVTLWECLWKMTHTNQWCIVKI